MKHFLSNYVTSLKSRKLVASVVNIQYIRKRVVLGAQYFSLFLFLVFTTTDVVLIIGETLLLT